MPLSLRLCFPTCVLIVALSAPFHACAREADDEVTANPDRASVADSSFTVAAGFVQLEMGVTFSRQTDEAARRHALSTPFLFRLGFARNVELRVGGDGFLYHDTDAGTASGVGDLQVGGKYRFLDEGSWLPSLGIEPAVKLPVASRSKGLGTGQPDFTMPLLLSKDLPFDFHIDANGSVAYLGRAEHPGRFFFQQAASLVVSRSIAERLSPFWEIAWVSPSAPREGDVLSTNFGAVYLLYPKVAIDLWTAVGLSKAADSYAIFGGITVLLGHKKR